MTINKDLPAICRDDIDDVVVCDGIDWFDRAMMLYVEKQINDWAKGYFEASPQARARLEKLGIEINNAP